MVKNALHRSELPRMTADMTADMSVVSCGLLSAETTADVCGDQRTTEVTTAVIHVRFTAAISAGVSTSTWLLRGGACAMRPAVQMHSVSRIIDTDLRWFKNEVYRVSAPLRPCRRRHSTGRQRQFACHGSEAFGVTTCTTRLRRNCVLQSAPLRQRACEYEKSALGFS